VRKALGVIVIGVVLTLALSAAGASSGTRQGRVQQFRGIPSAEVALQRALAIFRPQLAGPRFRESARDPRGATIVLRDLAATMSGLTGAERRLAESILARPTDGKGGDYTAPKGDFKRTCPANVCIHWVTSTRDAPSLADKKPKNGVPDWIDKTKGVMKTVWSKEISNLGYKKPKPDPPFGGHHGGNPNSKLDIFIQDVGRFGIYGFCTTDDPKSNVRRDVSAYCVFDDNYAGSQFPGIHGVNALKVTAAHEFHHASQFAYDWKEDRALLEATATNMEADVYGSIHDNFQYFAESPLRHQNNNTDGPWWPVDMFDAEFGNQYGDWIFYRFLEEYFGGATHPSTVRDASINRQIWNQAKAVPGTNNGGKYSTQAITAAIAARTDPITSTPADFSHVFANFGWANAKPEDWYKDGDQYPSAGFVNRGFFGSGDSDAQNWPMFHFANDYVLFKPDPTSSTIDFTLDFPPTAEGANGTILVLNTNGTVVPTDLGPLLSINGDAVVNGVPFDDATVAGVVLVITNDSVAMEHCGTHSFSSQVTFACRGDALDDFGSGGFNYSVDVN
jgi:hypothetical protein